MTLMGSPSHHDPQLGSSGKEMKFSKAVINRSLWKGLFITKKMLQNFLKSDHPVLGYDFLKIQIIFE